MNATTMRTVTSRAPIAPGRVSVQATALIGMRAGRVRVDFLFIVKATIL